MGSSDGAANSDEERESEVDVASSAQDQEDGESEDISRYLPLYKAALSGDWETAKSIFDRDNDAVTAAINNYRETPLHVAVLSGKSNDFVKNLVDMLPLEALAIRDCAGHTAMYNAFQVGNTEAAKTLVTKNPNLLYILSNSGRPPVLQASIYLHKDTVKYLLFMSETNRILSPFHGQSGVDLLITAIYSRFLGIALNIVDKYPNLARLKSESYGFTALSAMADMGKIFLSGEKLSWWERWIYHRIPLKQHKLEAEDMFNSLPGDIENGISEGAPVYNKDFLIFCGVCKKLEFMLWKVIQRLEIREKKAVHQKALLLVKLMCKEMLTLPYIDASSMFKGSITKAATSGISEIVEQNIALKKFLISDRKYQFYDTMDKEGNNFMHVCGKLAPSNSLNLVPGAALQMQRELQWYNEMEKFVHPSRHMRKNKRKKIPNMLFTEEHKQLKVDGERWMKDTANACSISAALIATVMFAAVFTLPGGIENGIPVFSSDPVFILFAVSDAVSLFTSITSLLMFLSILTSRYAEQDFLHVLPKRLSIGLLSLFISITFMMIAYSAAMSYVIKMSHMRYLIPIATLACLPVTSFVLLQFPLLVEVVYSTYGPGIFGKKTDSILY